MTHLSSRIARTFVYLKGLSFRAAVSFVLALTVGYSLSYAGNAFFGISRLPNWIALDVHAPSLLLLLLIAQCVFVCLSGGRAQHKLFAPVLCSSILLLAYVLLSIVPLGDHDHWIWRSSTTTLAMSEFLANFVYSRVFRSGLDLNCVAPVFGWITFLAYIYVGCGLFSLQKDRHSSAALMLHYLSSGCVLLFFYGYIENTFLSTPFYLLYVLFCFSLSHVQQQTLESARSDCLPESRLPDSWRKHISCAVAVLVCCLQQRY
jgi:hypothetical protein